MTMNLHEELELHSEDDVEATPEYQIVEFDNRQAHQGCGSRQTK